MNLHYWLALFPYLLSALISAAISLDIMRRKTTSGANEYICLAALECLWAAGYVFQALQTELAPKLFWNNVQFVGAVGAPVAFFWFAINFSDYRGPGLRRMGRAAIWLALAMLVFIVTDTRHHLFRLEPSLYHSDPFIGLTYQPGPAFFLFPLFNYSLLTTAFYLLVKKIIASAPIYRLQTLTILVGALIPWLFSLLTWLRILPVNLHDVTPLTFVVSNLIVVWGLTRYGLFDLVPVAYNTLVDHIEDGLLVLDNRGRILDLNRVARQILHLDYHDVIGMPFSTVLPQGNSLPDLVNTDRPVEISLTVERKRRYYELRYIVLHEAGVSNTRRMVLLHDITERKENEDRLQRMAITDPLTDIYNRRQFFSMAEVEYKRSVRNHQPFSILLLDIDRFKAVNDQCGHPAGDQVLQQTVTRCQARLRPYDILARYGGDEFVVLLPETGPDESLEIAQRLRLATSSSAFATQSGPVSISFSIGVATCGDNVYPRLDQLIDQADQALYTAKLRGRNQVCLWKQPCPDDANIELN